MWVPLIFQQQEQTPVNFKSALKTMEIPQKHKTYSAQYT